MRELTRRLLLYTLILAGLVLAGPVQAVTLQQAEQAKRTGQRVYDLAGVLSPEEAQRLTAQLARMETADLAQGAVVILDRTEGGTSVKEYATDLLKRWGVGHKAKDDGFVLVVSIGDRHWELESGSGLETILPDAEVGRLTRQDLAPAFREGRYGAGLAALLSDIEKRIQAAGGAEAIPAGPAPAQPPAPMVWLCLLLGAGTVITFFRAWPRGSVPGRDPWLLPTLLLGASSAVGFLVLASGSPPQAAGLVLVALVPAAIALARLLEERWTPIGMDSARPLAGRASMVCWGVVGLGALAGFTGGLGGWVFPFLLLAIPAGFAVQAYLARSPRRCRECGGPLRWLPEAEEAPFLSEEENLEQQLGSVDYDVWRCEKDNRSAVIAHVAEDGNFTTCPKCHRRTLSTEVVLNTRATGGLDGTARAVEQCRNPRCRYHHEETRHVTPTPQPDAGIGGIIVPTVLGGLFGGWGGGGSGGGESDGGGFSGPDLGDFGGGGSGGGGAGGDW